MIWVVAIEKCDAFRYIDLIWITLDIRFWVVWVACLSIGAHLFTQWAWLIVVHHPANGSAMGVIGRYDDQGIRMRFSKIFSNLHGVTQHDGVKCRPLPIERMVELIN